MSMISVSANATDLTRRVARRQRWPLVRYLRVPTLP